MTSNFLSTSAMSHRIVTGKAVHSVSDEILVTMETVLLQDLPILRSNENGIMKILKSKTFGVPETVFEFCEIFGNEIFWRMAGITGGHRMMTRFPPAVIMIPHNMTVGASFGIVAEVGNPFCVIKSVTCETDEETDHAA